MIIKPFFYYNYIHNNHMTFSLNKTATIYTTKDTYKHRFINQTLKLKKQNKKN